MNEDFRDLLFAMVDTGVRFLVVGAHALAVHGVPRATGDLDVWVEPTTGSLMASPRGQRLTWNMDTEGSPSASSRPASR